MSAKDQPNEDLSCLIDGELGDSEARFLLRRMGHDDELRARWARWHRIRDSLTGQGATQLGDLSTKITAAIEHEPTPQQVTGQQSGATLSRWLKPVAGLGVAAAVAALAINLTAGPDLDGQPAAVAQLADAPSEIVEDRTPVRAINNSTRVVSGGFNQPLDPRLQEYLIRHNALSETRRGQGLVSYRYVVSPNSQDMAQTVEQGAESNSNDGEILVQ